MPDSIDKIMADWIAVQRAGAGMSAKLQAETKKIFREVRRISKEDIPPFEMAKKINKVFNKASPELYAKLKQELQKVGQPVANKATKDIANAGIKPRKTTITQKDITKWMNLAAMTTSNITVKNMYDRTMRNAREELQGATAITAAQDDPVSALRQRINDVEAKSLRHMNTIGTSSVNQVANASKQKVYVKHSDDIDRVMWVSTLDHRTSPFCQVADGKVFPIDSGPRPPAHPNCRSTVVLMHKDDTVQSVQRDMLPRPAVEAKSEEALEEKGLRTRTGKKRKPSRTDRSPLKGTTARNTTYETWLRSQPAYYQDAILGKESGKRFRTGEALGSVLKDTRSAINFESLDKALGA